MARRQPAESQIKRARRSLDMLLVGWDGALSSDSSIDADYRQRVRTASYRARQALKTSDLTPAEVVAQLIAPVFQVTES